jgi:hypothetical protein
MQIQCEYVNIASRAGHRDVDNTLYWNLSRSWKSYACCYKAQLLGFEKHQNAGKLITNLHFLLLRFLPPYIFKK